MLTCPEPRRSNGWAACRAAPRPESSPSAKERGEIRLAQRPPSKCAPPQRAIGLVSDLAAHWPHASDATLQGCGPEHRVAKYQELSCLAAN